jgi:uncharacterized repeat protein (TIGR01451 family)
MASPENMSRIVCLVFLFLTVGSLTADPATHFRVTAPAIATSGTSFNFTVTALDEFDDVDTTYGGIVNFKSSTGGALFSDGSTLTGGSATFSVALVFYGTSTITATDTVDPSITGTSAPIDVRAAVNSANLAITKTTTEPFFVAQNGTYLIRIRNDGPDTVTSVRVTDTLAPGTLFVSVTPSQGSCSGTTTVTCNLGIVSVSTEAEIRLTVMPSEAATLSNTATVISASSRPDPDLSNNSSTATVTVLPAGSIPTLNPYLLALMALTLAIIALRS